MKTDKKISSLFESRPRYLHFLSLYQDIFTFWVSTKISSLFESLPRYLHFSSLYQDIFTFRVSTKISSLFESLPRYLHFLSLYQGIFTFRVSTKISSLFESLPRYLHFSSLYQDIFTFWVSTKVSSLFESLPRYLHFLSLCPHWMVVLSVGFAYWFLLLFFHSAITGNFYILHSWSVLVQWSFEMVTDKKMISRREFLPLSEWVFSLEVISHVYCQYANFCVSVLFVEIDVGGVCVGGGGVCRDEHQLEW